MKSRQDTRQLKKDENKTIRNSITNTLYWGGWYQYIPIYSWTEILGEIYDCVAKILLIEKKKLMAIISKVNIDS